jgi:hypothetical protein
MFFSNIFPVIIDVPTRERPQIRNIHVQKIGTISAKKDKMSIYNIEAQISIELAEEVDSSKINRFVLTIGNSNSAGISEE